MVALPYTKSQPNPEQMLESRNKFEWTTEISKAGIVIFIAIIALVAALLFSGCNASDSAPATDSADTVKTATQTTQSIDEKQKEEWVYYWYYEHGKYEGSMTVKPIKVTDGELYFQGDWEEDGNTGETTLKAIKLSTETAFYEGQTRVTFNSSSMSDIVTDLQLKKISDECYIGDNKRYNADSNSYVEVHVKGVECTQS